MMCVLTTVSSRPEQDQLNIEFGTIMSRFYSNTAKIIRQSPGGMLPCFLSIKCDTKGAPVWKGEGKGRSVLCFVDGYQISYPMQCSPHKLKDAPPHFTAKKGCQHPSKRGLPFKPKCMLKLCSTLPKLVHFGLQTLIVIELK
jgi:hypothetical protein